jgi:twitching motility protein PilI
VPGAPWLLGVANVRATCCRLSTSSSSSGERTVPHELARLLVRQPGGDVAVLIDELYGHAAPEPQVEARPPKKCFRTPRAFRRLAYRVDEQL